jgi:pimeloyl-ACP methyl ester carboxylesterase
MAISEDSRTELHCPIQGTGAPVVALHGSASSGGQWRSLVGYLEGSFQVLTPDLPGNGRSPALRPAASGLAPVADALDRVVARSGQPVHLVGHSFGAAVALKLALLRPDRVRSLTLIEPAAFHLLRQGDASDRALHAEIDALADTIYRYAAEGESERGMARFVDFWVGPRAWKRTSARLRASLTASLGQVLADFAAIATETDTLEACAKLACPTLCMMGQDSPEVSRRVTERLAAALPGARLEAVPGAGHLLPLTDPHVVDPAIRRHLRAVDGSIAAGRLAVAA